MRNYLDKIIEAIHTNIGTPIDDNRTFYSISFAIPVNVLAELFFFLNTYIFSLPLTLLKLFSGRRPSLLGFFGSVSIILILCPLSMKDKNLYYGLVGTYTLLAYFASFRILVIKNSPISFIFAINKLITTLLTTLCSTIVLTGLTLNHPNQDSLFSAISIIFLLGLFGSKYRASTGRRASFLMMAACLLSPITPLYPLVGLGLSTVLILVPAIYRYSIKLKGKGTDVDYSHRDLEVMKLFGQASASGYAFEERLIPVIDSLGFDTKFAKFYKSKGDFPPEYINKSGSGDGGVDLIGLSEDCILLVQCKFKKNPVDASVISQLVTTGKIFERYYRSKKDTRKIALMLCTSSSLNSTARANSREENVIVVDGEALKKMTSTGRL